MSLINSTFNQLKIRFIGVGINKCFLIVLQAGLTTKLQGSVSIVVQNWSEPRGMMTLEHKCTHTRTHAHKLARTHTHKSTPNHSLLSSEQLHFLKQKS